MIIAHIIIASNVILKHCHRIYKYVCDYINFLFWTLILHWTECGWQKAAIQAMMRYDYVQTTPRSTICLLFPLSNYVDCFLLVAQPLKRNYTWLILIIKGTINEFQVKNTWAMYTCCRPSRTIFYGPNTTTYKQ